MLTNRLKPFRPELLHVTRVRVAGMGTLGDVDVYEEYGFQTKSLQTTLFKQGPKGAVAFVLESKSGTARTLSDDSVVARLFGERVGTQLVVWHLSIQKKHVLNNSQSGTRWGTYGIQPVPGTKPRWVNSEGELLNKTNARFNVKGTPNPYAVSLLVQVGELLKCTSIRQHEAMPCAQLFDTQYSHQTHPATLLIYRSLGFDRSKELDAYVWNDHNVPSLAENWNRILYCMSIGMPAVVEGLSKPCKTDTSCFHACETDK